MQQRNTYADKKKVGTTLTHRPERALVALVMPYMPLWLKTYHLTLATIPMSLLIIAFSYLGRGNIHWLWIVSLLIATQWLTDLFDGAVGRAHNEGFVRWGFYMDHLLDYIFLTSILIGYMLLLPDQSIILYFFILALAGSFMVSSFLSFATTGAFKISFLRIGPTEIRMIFILINTLIIIFGKTYLAGTMPYVLVFLLIGLCILVYRTQQDIWRIDMKLKKTKKQNNIREVV